MKHIDVFFANLFRLYILYQRCQASFKYVPDKVPFLVLLNSMIKNELYVHVVDDKSQVFYVVILTSQCSESFPLQ